jgi:hypothetical protein
MKGTREDSALFRRDDIAKGNDPVDECFFEITVIFFIRNL